MKSIFVAAILAVWCTDVLTAAQFTISGSNVDWSDINGSNDVLDQMSNGDTLLITGRLDLDWIERTN